MTRVRFLSADSIAIRETMLRHHFVSEKRDELAGESTILCSCGASFGPLPKAESVLEEATEHVLRAMMGSAG